MTTFNPSDKSATITLSNGNLTATSSTSVGQAVRSTTSYSSGKIYFEVTLGTVTTDIAIGIANSSWTLSDPGQLGSNTQSVGFYAVSPTQAIYYNSSQLSTGASASSNGEIVSVAVDFTNKLIWVKTAVMIAASQPWNNSSSANPATGTAGVSFSGIAAGPYFVTFDTLEGGSVATVNFGNTAFNRAAPSGFSPWDNTPVTATGAAKITPSCAASVAAVNSVTGVSVAGFARASTATYFDATGRLQSSPTNTPRLTTYNPTTLALIGGLYESAATNIIRNPRAEGATSGTIGGTAVAPTDWYILGLIGNGLTGSIANSSENGLSAIDITISGTPTATATNFIEFDAINVLPSTAYAHSFFVKLTAGSLTNVTLLNYWQEYDGSSVVILQRTASVTPTGSALSAQRSVLTNTTTSATALIASLLTISYTSGAAVNLTLRVTGPQLEVGAAATSLILPPAGSPAAATRATDYRGSFIPSASAAISETVTGIPKIAVSALASITAKDTLNAAPHLTIGLASSTSTAQVVNAVPQIAFSTLGYGASTELSSGSGAISLTSAASAASVNFVSAVPSLALSTHGMIMILVDTALGVPTLPLSCASSATITQTASGTGVLSLSGLALDMATISAAPSLTIAASGTAAIASVAVAGCTVGFALIGVAGVATLPAPPPAPPSNPIAVPYVRSTLLFTPSPAPPRAVATPAPPPVIKPVLVPVAAAVAYPTLAEQGLNAPTAVAWAGTTLLYSSGGDLIMVRPIGTRLVMNVALSVMGIAVDPGYAANGYIYLAQTDRLGGLGNSVTRYVLSNGGLSAGTVIINWNSSHGNNGGAISFGPDGALYVATGDANDPYSAQNLVSQNGKILRLNPDGSKPSSNPFGSLIYAFGLRAPGGLTWQGNRLWATDRGAVGNDKVLLVKAGQDYGHPITSGYTTVKDQYGLQTTAPVLCSGIDDTWGISGISYANGALFFGCMGGGSTAHSTPALARTPINGASLGVKTSVYDGAVGAVAFGRDGCIWYGTGDTLYRISP